MNQRPLNRLALIWILAATSVIDGLFVWPLHVVIAAGQNADIALVGALLWALVWTLVISNHPSQHAVAQWWTSALDIAVVLVLWAVDADMINQLASMLQTFFYFDTPRWALVVPLVVVVMFTFVRNTNTVWHIIVLWVPILLGVSLFIFGLALVNMHHPRAVLPNQVISLRSIAGAVGILAYIGLPVGVTLRRVTPRMASPPSPTLRVLAIVVPWLFLCGLYVITVGALGPEAVTAVRWPVAFTLDHVTLDSTFFLSRIGLVVVFSWTLGVGLGLIVHVRLLENVLHWPIIKWAAPMAWIIASLSLGSPQSSTAILLNVITPIAQLLVIIDLVSSIVLRVFFRRARETKNVSLH